MIKDNIQKGFSLVETLVAITILLVTIMGPLYAFQQSIQSHYIARDKLIATALAQDGMEYVRSIRDNNYLNGRPWLTSIDTCIGSGVLCNVDSVSDTVAVCPSAVCTALTLNSKKQYTHSSGLPYTKFYRTVNLRTINASEEEIVVKVQWKNSVGTSTVNIIGELYNWQ